MKLSIPRDRFAAALAAASLPVSGRNTLPVLAMVYLQVTKNTLTVTGTDLDLTVSARVGALDEREGGVCLPAKKLHSIVRELAGQMVELEVDAKHHATLRCAHSAYKLNGMDPEEFPKAPPMAGAQVFTVPEPALQASLRLVDYAMSRDISRFVLMGVLFQLGKGERTLTLVTTDGRRLATATRAADNLPESTQWILPAPAVAALRSMAHGKGEVSVSYTVSHAAFELPGADPVDPTVTVTSKLVDGSYPNYRQVLPDTQRHRLEIPRAGLVAAVRRARLMTSEKASSVRLTFAPGAPLIITASSPEVGDAREAVDGVVWTGGQGKELEISFNPDYLLEGLSAMEQLAEPPSVVNLDLEDGLSPGVIRVPGQWSYVMMPMRTA
jgi:DNA polymerase III subunit beta